jgi:hypothetical protein
MHSRAEVVLEIRESERESAYATAGLGFRLEDVDS